MPKVLSPDNPFGQPALEALASWIELEATIKMTEAMVMRNDRATLEGLRQRAHDLLDAHMDAKQSAAVLMAHAMGRNRDGKSS